MKKVLCLLMLMALVLCLFGCDDIDHNQVDRGNSDDVGNSQTANNGYNESSSSDKNISDNTRWFEYKGEKAISMTGLWFSSHYYIDEDGIGKVLEADGAGISFELLEMDNPPTIYYDINSDDKISYYDSGEKTEKSFRLWKPDKDYTTIDFGSDIYTYLNNNPGTYFLTVDRFEERITEGRKEKAGFTEGVKLIASGS